MFWSEEEFSLNGDVFFCYGYFYKKINVYYWDGFTRWEEFVE